jgi:hypothetical protein
MSTPARYRLHRLARHRFLVIENSTEPLFPHRATVPIASPWAGVKIGVGSVLLLADETASQMRAGGGIESIPAEALRPWREVEDEKRAARWEARRAKRLSREGTATAGRPDQSGDQAKPQAQPTA